MKIYYFCLVFILTGCSSYVGESDSLFLGKYVLNFTQIHARKNAKSLNNTNEYFELYTALASINNPTANKFLIACSVYYKGEAPYEFYIDLVAKKGANILPLLETYKKTECDSAIYKCSSGAIDLIIDKINKKQYSEIDKDNIGDDFRYLSVKEILAKIRSLKEGNE